MSATAIGLSQGRASRFYDSSVGKKAVMAVTGVVLFGFIIGHLLGNLQFFEGPDQLNAYSRFLHSNLGLLWGARIALLAAVSLHIASAISLALRKREARPVGYVRKQAIASNYASRTMYWSGPIIAAFVIYHLLDFTFGVVNPGYQEGEVYTNVVRSFQNPAIGAFYILAMLLLCLHLQHGIWSMFQTLGLFHPRYTPLLKRASAVIAILIFLGFVSLPVAVLTGLRS
jgi:succinate dehydrogenase / fumarate reductase cytochrome b subunit